MLSFNPGCYLFEDNHFVMYEISKYKMALDLTGVSCAKLKWLQVLYIIDQDHFKGFSGLEFLDYVHNQFNFEEVKKDGQI